MTYRRKHDRHAPRSWLSLFIRLGGWASIALGVVLMVLTLFSVTQLSLADQLDRSGKFTRAVIVDKTTKVTTDSDGDTVTSYYVTFQYKATGGGQKVERGVDVSFYRTSEEDDEVVIRYARDNPRVFEYDIGSYRRAGNVLRWVALLFGLGGIFTLWRFGKETNRAILARRDGEKRLAKVIGIAETSVEVNGRRQARLAWREDDGQTGESLMRDIGALSRLYKAGDPIVVFRLGDDCFWEGDVGPPRREVETNSGSRKT